MNAINNNTIIAAGSNAIITATTATSAKRRRLNPSVVTAGAACADNHVGQVPPCNTRHGGLGQLVQETAQEMPSEVASTAATRANKRRYDEAMPAAAPAR